MRDVIKLNTGELDDFTGGISAIKSNGKPRLDFKCVRTFEMPAGNLFGELKSELDYMVAGWQAQLEADSVHAEMIITQVITRNSFEYSAADAVRTIETEVTGLL